MLGRNSDAELTSCAFDCELKFAVVQVDPVTGEEEGEPDEEKYPVENLDIFVSDFFIIQTRVLDFRRCWESTDNQIADEMKRIEAEDNVKNYDHGVKSTLETYYSYFMHDLIQKSI